MSKIYPAFILLIMLALLTIVLFNADKIDGEPPPIEQQVITCQATAFNAYGTDSNGIDYGPGYVIVSSYSDIPLYSLLEIDQYGEGQVMSKSVGLEKHEIMVWYNAPSKIDMFGRQTVQVRVLGDGDRPHQSKQGG
jgi:3D (Asp-Asp-Asp) domain-containing protein